MAKHLLAIVIAFTLATPALASAVSAECGDGSVPVGVWPNCEPCAGGGAAQAVEGLLKRHGDVLDTIVDPAAYDYIEKCLAALEGVFFINVGLPSIEEILGMLCQATRQYAQQWMNKLKAQVSISDPYGLVTGTIGGSAESGSGGITVTDTSRQALEAAKGCF